MRINQIITDYVMKSILTTKGDMLVRGDAIPEKLTAVVVQRILKSAGVGEKPVWGVDRAELTTHGDMTVRGAVIPEGLAAVAVGQVLKSAGVGAKPAWGVDRSELTTHGDITVRGAAVPERLAAVAVGQVLKSAGVGAKPAWGVPKISDMDMATGTLTSSQTEDRAVSGLGFVPGLIVFLFGDSPTTSMNWGIGLDNGTIHVCQYVGDAVANQYLNGSLSIYVRRDVNNIITGYVLSIDGDGFTIRFVETNTSVAVVRWFAIG